MKLNIAMPFFIITLGIAFDSNAQPTGSYQSNVKEAFVPTELLNKLTQRVEHNIESAEGSPYLFEQYSKGEIYSNKYGKVNGYTLNYDLARDELLISLNKMIRVIEIHEVDSFIISDPQSQYCNLAKISNRVLEGIGILHAKTIDKYLVTKTSAKLLPPDYSPQFNTGSKNSKWLRKETSYIVSNSEIVKLPTSKKNALKVFGEKSKDISDFADKRNIKFKSIDEWVLAFDYFNTLTL